MHSDPDLIDDAHLHEVAKEIGRFAEWKHGIRLVGLAALLIGVAGIVTPWDPNSRLGGIMTNLSAELMGVAVTVLVIDWFYERRRKKERLGEVIGLIASGSHDFGLAGIAEARHHGWLYDGSLEGANLHGANLRGSRLNGACLQGAQMDFAILSEALLGRVHLERADLSASRFDNARLEMAHLEGANLTLSDLSEAGLSLAHLEGADLHATRGLTQEQIESALGDGRTILPDHLSRPAHWTKKDEEGD